MKSIELKQERAKLVAESRKLLDAADNENRELNGEEESQWQRMNAEIDRLGRDAEKAERKEHVSALEEELKASVRKTLPTPVGGKSHREITNKDRSLAFRGWLKGDTEKALSTEERDACERVGYSPYTRQIAMRAAMLEGSAGAGQELATFYPGIAQYIDFALKAYGSLWATSTVIPTFNGIQFKLPVLNPTANKATIVGEAGSTTPFNPTTSNVTFNCWTYRAQYIASLELLQDSLLNLEEFFAKFLAESFLRGTNTDFITGAGSAGPQGLTVGATASGVTLTGSGATAAITADNLIDLEHSVDPLYRKTPQTGFVMHDQTLAKIRKLKDNNGQYLWTTAGGYNNTVAQSQPDRILGYPVYINQDMPQLGTATNVVVCFGDLSKYYIRRVMEYTFLRQNELYSANGEFGFIAFMRLDGRVVDAGTHPIQSLVNP